MSVIDYYHPLCVTAKIRGQNRHKHVFLIMRLFSKTLIVFMWDVKYVNEYLMILSILFSCCYTDESNKFLSSHKIFYWSLLKAKKPRVFSENCKSLQLIKGTKKRFVKKQRQGFRSAASSEYYANVRISKKNIAKIIYLTIVDFPKSERIFYIIRIKRTTCRLDSNQSLRLWSTQANALIIKKKFFLQVHLLSHFEK